MTISATKVVELTFELTDDCPFECQHCSSISHKNVHLPEDAIINIIKKYVQKNNSGKIAVRLSGGEPLCWQGNLRHLLRSIKNLFHWGFPNFPDLKHDITLLTTGSGKNLTPINREILELVTGISVSLYGDERAHASIISRDPRTGKVGYWNAIRAIYAASFLGITTGIHVLPVSQDIDTINDFLRHGLPKGVNVHVLKALPHGRCEYISMDKQRALARSVFNATLSHSFDGDCDIQNKVTVLPDGKEVHCSANKCEDLGIVPRRCDLFFDARETN